MFYLPYVCMKGYQNYCVNELFCMSTRIHRVQQSVQDTCLLAIQFRSLAKKTKSFVFMKA